MIDDDAGMELEMALTKTRKLRQKKKRSTLADRVLEAAAQDSDEDETPGGAAAAIILNETSEFCRSLGDIPSYGMAGNRDEEEMDVSGNTLEIMFIWINLISQIIEKQCEIGPYIRVLLTCVANKNYGDLFESMKVAQR